MAPSTQYLERAAEIIGERTPDEERYDREVVRWLERSALCISDETRADPPEPKAPRWPERRDLKVRYHIDVATGQPHIYKHGVSEPEVEEVVARPGEDRPGTEGSRVTVGQTTAGRYLRIIYVPDPEPDSVFVITAYEVAGKPLLAYRRRRRRKR